MPKAPAPSAIRSACVYLRRGVYYVHPLAGSQGGDPCLFMGPVLPVSEDAGIEALDAVVRRSIEASHHHAPWPSDWKGLTDPLLVAAGVKSMAAFMKGAAYIRIDVENGEVRVTPTTTKIYRNAFSPVLDHVVRARSGASPDLGRAVVHGMALCD